MQNQKVTSTVGALPQMSMSGGLCEDQIRELFNWMEAENVLWTAALERFGNNLTDAVGSSGTVFKLWIWARRDRKLTDEHFSGLYLTDLVVDSTFKRIRMKCEALRREGK